MPNSLLYDPEEVGFMLRSVLKPIDWSGDFQDYPLWRVLVPEVGRQLMEQYGRTLIVPMTVWQEDYFKEVKGGFQRFGANFQHFCLTAPLETIQERIRQRGEQDEGHWAYAQAERCAEAFKSSSFDERLDTVGKDPKEIAEYIISRIQ